MRNAVDAEEENQVRQKAELQALINEKKAQWERCVLVLCCFSGVVVVQLYPTALG